MSDYASPAAPAVQPDPWVARQLADGLSREEVLAAMEQAGWTRLDAWQVIEATAAQGVAPEQATAPAAQAASGDVSLALSAALVAALAGGLLWAVMGIVTGYDIGIVAWLVGVLTGTALVRAGGGTVPLPIGVLAGLFAGLAIVLGKYVFFIHAIRESINETGVALAAPGYFDTDAMRYFVQHPSVVMEAFDLLWIGLAVFAAVRIASRDAFGQS